MNLENFNENWKVELPKFDIPAMREHTKNAPTWLHVGAGNLLRGFIAPYQQNLLESGDTSTGIIVYEPFDSEIIPAVFAPHDNLTLAVKLNADGTTKKRVIASIADAFSCDLERLAQVIANPSLQLISLTITEKGYIVSPETVCKDPTTASTALEQIVLGLFSRFESGVMPPALVSMDNFADNGAVLYAAISTIADAWLNATTVDDGFTEYIKSIKCPCTMVDKITPRPSQSVAKSLAAEGFEYTKITMTTRGTFVAPFVNAEETGYLIIEDDFPLGRPPLDKAGVHLTDRETVSRAERMKICACLNPLHTILAISGMLLGYPSISKCMGDQRLVKLIRTAGAEAMTVVPHPGIIDPVKFLNEAITQRFPNPFIPDTPARIATDTSQKIPVRFGVTLRARADKGTTDLSAIPFFIALWLRYRMGIDDSGIKINLSPDPELPAALNILYGLPFGKSIDLRPILSDENLFGVDLYEMGLGKKIEKYFAKLSLGEKSVSNELTFF